jgi:hypothetical protein
MCNLTALTNAGADSGTWLGSSLRLRLSDPRKTVYVLITGYISGCTWSDMVSLVKIHASASARAIEIDIWLSST